MNISEALSIFKRWLAGLSFRTGIIVLGCCVVFYVVSFAQFLLPVPAAWKGVMWTVLFGLAKATQYSALLIIGKEGVVRLRQRFVKRRVDEG